MAAGQVQPGKLQPRESYPTCARRQIPWFYPIPSLFLVAASCSKQTSSPEYGRAHVCQGLSFCILSDPFIYSFQRCPTRERQSSASDLYLRVLLHLLGVHKAVSTLKLFMQILFQPHQLVRAASFELSWAFHRELLDQHLLLC